MSGQTQHFVKVEVRGPTSDAAQQDALWMYYQIQSGGEIIHLPELTSFWYLYC